MVPIACMVQSVKLHADVEQPYSERDATRVIVFMQFKQKLWKNTEH